MVFWGRLKCGDGNKCHVTGDSGGFCSVFEFVVGKI